MLVPPTIPNSTPAPPVASTQFRDEKSLAAALAGLPSLRRLHLEGNPLTELPFYRDWFIHCLPKLEVLDGKVRAVVWRRVIVVDERVHAACDLSHPPSLARRRSMHRSAGPPVARSIASGVWSSTSWSASAICTSGWSLDDISRRSTSFVAASGTPSRCSLAVCAPYPCPTPDAWTRSGASKRSAPSSPLGPTDPSTRPPEAPRVTWFAPAEERGTGRHVVPPPPPLRPPEWQRPPLRRMGRTARPGWTLRGRPCCEAESWSLRGDSTAHLKAPPPPPLMLLDRMLGRRGTSAGSLRCARLRGCSTRRYNVSASDVVRLPTKTCSSKRVPVLG